MIEDQKKELLIVFGVLISATVVCIVLLQYMGIQSAILATLLLPLIPLFYLHPRWGLLGFLTYLQFNGTVAYSWAEVFQAKGGLISYTIDYTIFQLAKDLPYLSALLGIILMRDPLRQLVSKFKPLIIAISIFFGLCLLIFFSINLPLQFTNPASKALFAGGVGLKIWLGYIPLILGAYYFLDQPQNLLLLNRWLVILILICCSLCFVQYFLLVNDICLGSVGLPEPAATKASLQARCFVGGSLLYNPEKGLIRLPGTFASPWHWAWFLVSSSFIAYGAAISESSRRWQAVSWVSVASIIVATLISGQRTALLLVPIILLTLLVLTNKRKRWLPLKLAAVAVVSLCLAWQFPLVRQQLENFLYRWQYSPPQQFITGQFQWLLANYLKWLGHGVGTTTNAVAVFGNIRLIETFYVKLLYELGILGFLAFFGVVTCLTVFTFRAYRSLKTPSWRSLGLCLWLFILFMSYNPYHYPLVTDPVSAYYWFIAGLLLKLPELEKQPEM